MRLVIKTSTYGSRKLAPSYVSSIAFPMPLPPLPSLFIQVQGPHMKFGRVIHNIINREVMFHLRNPTSWIWAIKFMHIHFREVIPFVSIHKGGIITTQEKVWRDNSILMRGIFVRHSLHVLLSWLSLNSSKEALISSKLVWMPSTLTTSSSCFPFSSLVLSSHFTTLRVLLAIVGHCKNVT